MKTKLIFLLILLIAYTSNLQAQNVGIGTSSPASKLDVEGGISIGTSYAGTNAAPTNGAIIEGAVGIGTSIPAFKLQVQQDMTMNTDVTAAQFTISGATNNGKRMIFGYDTNGNGFGFIKSGNYGVTWTPIALQPNGGLVGIGITNPTENLSVRNVGSPSMLSVSNDNDHFFGVYSGSPGDQHVALISDNGQAIRFGQWGSLTAKSPWTERMRVDVNGNVGIGTPVPDDNLDVVGTAQVSSYLKVGNPTAPAGGMSYIELYSWAGNSITFQDYTCGANNWVITIGTNTYLYYDNPGSRSRHRVATTWFWVPSNAYDFQLHFVMTSDLENGYDGTFAEIANSDNPSAFYTVSSFYQDGYNTTAVGSAAGCAANQPQAAWSGGLGFRNPRSNSMPIAVYGKWVKIGLSAMSDVSNGSGSASVYTIGAYCAAINPLVAFNAGNIYAEKNVYAGRNVLFGDLAEYFKVNEPSEVGDVIALMPTKGDSYCVSKQKENPLLIGVYSTAPTLTLNNPDGGIPVALAGRVPVKVCDENGPIQIGDFLTSASRPGYAMKATNNCYVLGKAIENFSEKEGKIQCIVQTGWHNIHEAGRLQSTGSFYIPAGKSTIIIQDENALPSSKMFVSLLGNSGTTHWIGRKEVGAFEICFGSPLKQDLAFDYLIDNADNKAEKQEEGLADVAHIPADRIIEQRIELPEDDGFVPPTPPDPTKFYQLDEHNNLIEYTPKVKTIPNVITKETFFSSGK